MAKSKKQKELDKELSEALSYKTDDDTIIKPDGAYVYVQGICDGFYFNVNKIKSLIKMGADVNTCGEFGITPLHMAAMTDDTPFAKSLIKAGVDFEYYDYDEHPLYFTIQNSNTVLAKLFIKAGIDVNANNDDEWTPLYWAIDKDNIEMAKLFIKAGADVNIKDWGDKTPLHLAVEKDNMEMAKLLIKAGADVNAEDDDGNLPLDLSESKEMKYLLRQHMPSMRVVKIEPSSVLIKDGKIEAWMDVWVEGGSAVCEWNKYIFFTDRPKDVALKKWQDDCANFEEASSLAIYALEKAGFLNEDDDEEYEDD